MKIYKLPNTKGNWVKAEHQGKKLGRKIRSKLTPDLLNPKWKSIAEKEKLKTTGHCYIAAEAYYHLFGGKKAGLIPHVIVKKTWTHWFLKDKFGNIHDVTREQFGDKRPPYEDGRPTGFLTSKPSKRAKLLMERIK